METQEEKKPKKAIQVLKKTGIVVQYVIVFLAILITSSIRWMFRTWTSLNMNELMFHLQSPVEGTDTGIIKSYIVSCLLVSVVLTAVLVFLYIKIKNRRRIVLGISLGCMIDQNQRLPMSQVRCRRDQPSHRAIRSWRVLSGFPHGLSGPVFLR